MGSKGRTQGGVSLAVLVSLVCAAGASRAAAADDAPAAPPFRTRGLHDEAGQAVKRALAGADRLLGEPGCQDVLTDFHDASGRTLKEVLDTNEASAQTYLRWIVFTDGRDSRACRSRGTLAATEPQSRVVFICPTAFVEAARATPEEAEATLIHEMLHSLGLGENPPTSREITARVRYRCEAKSGDRKRASN